MKNIYIYIIDYQNHKNTTNNIDTALQKFMQQENIHWKVSKTKKGKPYFIEHPEIKFSISHSKDIWMIAFSNDDIGIDIQYKEKIEETKYNKIMKRFFHEKEIKEIDSLDRFYEVWTAKESYVKYTGTGIDENYAKFSTIPDSIEKEDQWKYWKISNVYFYETTYQEYQLCLCVSQKSNIIMNIDLKKN